ncbi:hypothetical protein BDD12DRAFT_499480 [Trichophaea hybrida]|nr:hypothetical protein BDD12DRAFT_499480 [Trichophaea hybrida]
MSALLSQEENTEMASNSRSAVGDDDDDDDEEDLCRCGHYSCYHSGHPIADVNTQPRPTVQLQESVELQGNSYGSAHGRKLSVSTVDDTAIMRTDRSANVTTLSAISGTTTERDSSTAGTPGTMIKPPWITKAAARVREDSPKRMTGHLQTALGHDERLLMSPTGLERPPSMSSNASMSDKEHVREKLKSIIEYTRTLSSNQISHRERLEMMEVVPQALEELADKVELMDDHVNEKVDSCETRLKNELDDRLAPIESFIKAHQARGEKRKRRHQARGTSEACENSSSIRHDRKRRKRHEERDSSELLNSQPHGITTTSFTTTSFTTTTSSFSSPVGNHHLPEHVAGLKVFSELEMLKSRIADMESVAAPTMSRPWIVEVVLIPPALRGIWADAGASIPNTQHTGSEIASASMPTSYKYQGSQSSGPVPFSFSPKSKVYKRLHSRGFIKRVHVVGPSGREVSMAIEASFLDIIQWLVSFSVPRDLSHGRSQLRSQISSLSSVSSSQRTAGAGGNRNLWAPLRKVYKQAALEFLPASELSSPALWTVDFLKANCMMRGTTRKPLYIIPRTSSRSTSSLTWDDIKQLDRVHDPDSEPEGDEPDDEEETYWKFDPKLDAMPSDLNTGSFFSEPFASFGPFPAEGGSLGTTPVKLSFSSHLAASPQRQEATPPDTVPQLQPRRSSKLNRAHTPVIQVDAEKDVLTEDDRENDLQVLYKRSPNSVNSAPLPQLRLSTISPPSPPQSYPQTTQHRRKNRSSKDPDAPPPQDRDVSPTDEDSPPIFSRSSGTQRTARSFEAFETLGVGGWQDDGGEIWNDSQVVGLEIGEDLGEMDWGSLFGTPTDDDILAGLGANDDDGVVEEGEVQDENVVPAAVVPLTPLPVGDSMVDYNGDGGYHSD